MVATLRDARADQLFTPLAQTFLRTTVLAPCTRAKGSRTDGPQRRMASNVKGPRPERAGKSLIRARLPLSISSLLDSSLEVPSGTFRHEGWWPHGGPLYGSDSPPSRSPPASVCPSNGKGRGLQSRGGALRKGRRLWRRNLELSGAAVTRGTGRGSPEGRVRGAGPTPRAGRGWRVGV